MDKPTRRSLEFRDLDDALRDVENLRARGYDRAGDWNLAQVCGHLADWIRFPLDGYPRPPLFLRPFLWLARHLIGPRELRKVLTKRAMPTAAPTFNQTIPLPAGDESAAVARLRDSVARFKAHTGPLHPSPLFGPLDRDTATKLQLIHCAHHLSFLVPRNA